MQRPTKSLLDPNGCCLVRFKLGRNICVKIKLQIPEKFRGFFDTPARNRVAYGGRGSGKSWSIAQMLIVRAMEKQTRILCVRELQKSIKDSSHKLLSDTIERLGVGGEFDVGETYIRHKKNGSDFIFMGLKHNPDGVKSAEGINIVWVEEAHRISRNSIKLLTPTLRAPGSECWYSFNPEDEDDEVYQRFVVNEPPARSVVLEVNWYDNPWFTPELEEERVYDLESGTDSEYKHTWEGELKEAREGAYYAEELVKLRKNNQITSVRYDPLHEVHTWWDIGISDYTSIWFVQYVGREVRVIDFFEMNGKGTDYYVKQLKKRGIDENSGEEDAYNYGTHNLPHDANHKQFTLDGKSIYDQFKEMWAGADFRVHGRTSNVNADIYATRTFLPRCVFDKEKCADGLKSLKHYTKKWNEERNQFDDNPYHNWASHACLIAGTLIETERGDVPIEQVRIGDMVMTPAGYSFVEEAGAVKKTNRLIEITFGDGNIITATPEHKFFTERGLVQADALRYTDVLLTDRSSVWKRILSYMKESSIGFREATTSVLTGQKERRVICIGRYGKNIMERFQKVVIYIIKTITQETMIYPTWNALAPATTLNCTQRQISGAEAMQTKSSLNQSTILLNNGTHLKKVLNGINSTAKTVGKRKNGILKNVKNVIENIKRLFPLGQNIATRIVKLQRLEEGAASQLVYDLTVRKQHCYMANGILVSNSDSLRYLAIGYREHMGEEIPDDSNPSGYPTFNQLMNQRNPYGGGSSRI